METLDGMVNAAAARAGRLAATEAKLEQERAAVLEVERVAVLRAERAAAERAAGKTGLRDEHLEAELARRRADLAAQSDELAARINELAARRGGLAEQYRTARQEHDKLCWMRDLVAALVKEVLAAPASRAPEPPADTEGLDLQPDPLTAATPAELAGMLRLYRKWAGQPSFRKMAAASGQAASASSLCTALGRDEMPRLDVVTAVIAGCGGDEERQRRWASAWRRIQLGRLDAAPAPGPPVLRAVPPAARAG
jgi:hypothetical protein